MADNTYKRHHSYAKLLPMTELQRKTTDMNGIRHEEFTLPALSTMAVYYKTLGPDTGTIINRDESTTLTFAPSMTPWKIGSTWLFLIADHQAGEQVTGYYTDVVLMLPCAAVTPLILTPAYIIPAATASTGGLITNTDNSGANAEIGKFVYVDGVTFIVDPPLLPAGKYAYVLLNQK